jgi:hypothetical protein
MPLSGLFSRLRRQPAPAAAADPIPCAPAGIDYLRAQAGLGPLKAAEPAAPPDIQPPDPAPSDSQPPDIQPSDIQPPDIQPSDVQPPDPASPAEPLTYDMFVGQAEQAEKAGAWAAAELIWRAIRTNIPQYWPSYTAGAGALCRLGRHDEARQLLDQGAALFPLERTFPLELGRLAAAASDWPAAETYWRAALAFDVRPWWVYTELAGALEHQDRLEDAETVFQEARIRADETDEITLFTYPAQLAGKRGDWATAVIRWAEACRRFPSATEFPARHQEALMRLAEHDPAAYQDVLRESGLREPGTTSP